MVNYMYFIFMEKFYNALAPDYDVMTDFNNRFEREEAVFKNIINRYSIQTALDAGAGTGFHSLLLAELGVRVTAVDISGEMLERLQHNAKRLRLSVDTVTTSFENISDSISITFDSIFCLGNSIVHVLSDTALEKSFSNFHSLLKPGGVLIIQILNYDRIIKERRRVQNIKKKRDITFIRFYDYYNDRLFFNILKLIDKDNRIDHTINTVELRPIKNDDLTDFLRRAGFTSIDKYGSLQFEPFDEKESSNLVTVAYR